MKNIINQSLKSLVAIALFSVAFSGKVASQDPHFSQYFTSPMTLNPSFTGKDVIDWRVSLTARSQWWGGSYIRPYNTQTLSVEKRILLDKLGDDQLAIGFLLLSDGSNSGVLKNNFFGTSVAYNKKMSSNTTFGAGISVHYANRILDPNLFQFESQFGSMGFQRSLPSNDYIVVQKNSYIDINAGINFSQTLDNWGYSIGVGYYHAARPKEGVYNNNQYAIDPRLNVQGSAWFALGQGNNKSTLHISSLGEFQGVNKVFTLGAIYKAKIGGDDTLESVNIGAFNRFTDAIYPYVGLEATNWVVGISYDAVTSAINKTTSVSSIELGFNWQFSKKTNRGRSTGKVMMY